MATDTSASANTDTSLKRTLASVVQDPAWEGSGNLQPATKRPKRETKLDRLKAKRKAGVMALKEVIEHEIALVKGKGVAEEVILDHYIHFCEKILAGWELNEHVLAIFKMSFEDIFVPEQVLTKELDQGMLPVEHG